MGLKIEYVSFIPGNNTPARVFRDKGIIQVNLSRWKDLPDFTKKYIIAHEEGHYNLQTIDEFKADEYAFNKLALTEPGSLKNTIRSLSNTLSMTSPQHYERVNRAILRALKTDANFNGNKEAEKMYKKLTEIKPQLLPVGFSKSSNFTGNNNETMIPREKIFPTIGGSFVDIRTSAKTYAPNFLDKTTLEAQGMTPRIGTPTFRQLHNNESEPVTYIYENGELVPKTIQKEIEEITPNTDELEAIALEMAHTHTVRETITMTKKNFIWVLILVVLLTVIIVKLLQK